MLVHGAWAGGWEWKKVGDRLLQNTSSQEIMEGGHVVQQTHPAEVVKLLEAAPTNANASAQ